VKWQVGDYLAHRRNLLNDLSGSEWLYWTDSIYLTVYPVDATHNLRKTHGAMKPPELMADIIKFFTKKGELVLDPFAGVGGTLLGAALAQRRALGYEINPNWISIYEQICRDFVIQDNTLIQRTSCVQSQGCLPISGIMKEGDCLELMSALDDASVDAIITDPPYGCDHATTGFAAETNFNMFNYDEERDFGNSRSFDEFYLRMKEFGLEAARVLKSGRYLVLIIGDRYKNGEYIPLGVRVADVMRSTGFLLKGIKIWSNKATQRPLKPYAVMSSFVPNITHQNIVILKKKD
jgi:DNA modification methylase